MEKVNVYILTSDPNSQRIKFLNNLFVSDLFKLQTIHIDDPSNLDLSKLSGFNQESGNELYKLKWILDHSAEQDPNNSILFLKDNLVTNADAITIENIVSEVMKRQWDIFYLSKWLDDCEKYDKNDVISQNGTIYTKTINPNGIEAVIIKPTLRDAIRNAVSGVQSDIQLNKNISQSILNLIRQKKIVASTLSPNLFNIDVSTAHDETYKLNECGSSSSYGSNIPQSIQNLINKYLNRNNGFILLFVLLLIILIIIAAALYKRNQRTK